MYNILNLQADYNIQLIEQELNEIKQEIHLITDKLSEMNSVETSHLYFNVDGMRKLTQVCSVSIFCVFNGCTSTLIILWNWL